MFNRHIREIWEMNVIFKDGSGLISPDFDKLDGKHIIKGDHILRFGSSSQLKDLQELVLKYLCYQRDLPTNGSKENMIKLLETYVCS
jgi:hypothetical protein